MRSRWTQFFVANLIIHLFTVSSAFSSAPYCMAIRGNGEAQPAHWGAMARLVENKGLPSQQSGGSSGAISMFLLENIAANPWVAEAKGQEQASRAAFMIKMIHGISNHLATSPKAQEVVDLGQFVKQQKATLQKVSMETLDAVIKAQSSDEIFKRRQQVLQVVATLQELGVGETQQYKELLSSLVSVANGQAPENLDLAKVRFFAQDLKQSIETFGAFSAKSDPYIFFRQGLLSFPKFAKSVGRVATFLSGKLWDASTALAFVELETVCRPGHEGQSWNTMIHSDAKKSCQDRVGKVVDTYFSQPLKWGSKSNNHVFLPIGKTIPSYPSTSVLIDSAFDEADAVLKQYYDQLDRSGAETFKISNSEDVKFGYWGDTAKLQSIGGQLSNSDAKSARFLNLGQATWLTALSASPAEPGLAPLQKIMYQGKAAYSAGGWADLHPVPVLKAANCESVIYVTRQGGESLFAQGIAKLLLNFQRPWEKLWGESQSEKADVKAINQTGDPSDLQSPWSNLYNVANPSSSYMTSVQEADAIVCTNWDSFNSRQDLVGIVEDGYQAPWVVQNPDLKKELAGTSLNLLDSAQLSPEQVGCGYQPK